MFLEIEFFNIFDFVCLELFLFFIVLIFIILEINV